MNKITYLFSSKLKQTNFSLLYTIFFFVLSASGFSQSDTAWVNPEHTAESKMGLKEGWFAGADFGSTLFYGDVALYNNFPKLKDFNKSFGNEYSGYGGKKFKFGLAAEAQVYKGNLQGQKIADKLYPRRFNADIMGWSVSAKYNLSQLIFRNRNVTKLSNRLSLFATVGIGQVYFRSRLYKLANNGDWYLEKANGYKSSGIDSSAGGLVTAKSKMASAITLPVGAKLNYKLNKKMDIVLDISYVTVFSDKLDGWVRDWTHKDRFLYTAVGLCYNFGRTDADELPYDQRYIIKKEATTAASGDGDLISPEPTDKKGSSKGGNLKPSKGDKDLEVKMKLYELQLKLFEMQYLLTQ